MTKIFLTGDRSRPAPVAVLFAASTIAQLAITAALTPNDPPLELFTGDNTGFEQGVRDFCASLGIPVTIIPTGTLEGGEPAWDTRHEVVNAATDRIVFVHDSPMHSHVVGSLLRVAGDKVELAMPLGLSA